MSLAFLPLSLFITVCVLIIIILSYILINRRNKDRKGLLVLYFTIILGVIASAILRILIKITNVYERYFNDIGYILLGYVVIIMFELFFLSITHKGSAKSRKIIILGWSFILIPLVFATVVYFAFK